MNKSPARYKPALSYHWLTRFYDPVVALTTRDRRIKTDLLEQAALKADEVVVDLGCGSGTLALMARQRWPTLRLTGVDGDPVILAQARHKAEIANATIKFDHAMVQSLPYPSGTFDAVLSSLLFHHLDRASKQAALQESLRVLRPGGKLHIADWGRPANDLMRLAFHGIQLLDGYDTTADCVAGFLPELLKLAGFKGVQETRRYSTILGTLSLYCGVKPVAIFR